MLITGLFCVLPLSAQDLTSDIQASKVAIKALAKSLQREMKAAMVLGGPAAAIKACNVKAQPLTEQISQQQGLTVSRTSLKYRNEENAPDNWERKTLLAFEEKLKQGSEITNLFYSEIVEEQGEKIFRMMKAIPYQQECSVCHGEIITPEIAKELDKLYPKDNARGFVLGDIRGAFSVKKQM